MKAHKAGLESGSGGGQSIEQEHKALKETLDYRAAICMPNTPPAKAPAQQCHNKGTYIHLPGTLICRLASPAPQIQKGI